MKRMGFVALFLGALLCLGNLASAQGVTPGPEHKMLAETEGTWDCKMKIAGAEMSGVSVNKMDLGGLWLVSEFDADFGGLPFKGKGLDSYDPKKKKFVSVWFDSMSAAPMVLEGDYDKEKKTVTFTGEGPSETGARQKFKSVITYTDKDHHSFSLYTIGDDGKETEMLSSEYTRRK